MSSSALEKEKVNKLNPSEVLSNTNIESINTNNNTSRTKFGIRHYDPIDFRSKFLGSYFGQFIQGATLGYLRKLKILKKFNKN